MRPSRSQTWTSLLVLAAVWSGQASAQTVNSGVGVGPSQQLSPVTGPVVTQAIDAPAVQRVFGDWDGPSSDLGRRGINIQLDALSEFAGNVTGGTKQGATFANQVGLEVDINWERLAHIVGLSTHVIMVQRSGSSDSALFGDNLSPVQEIYGSGGNVGVHLVSAYAEETLYHHRFDLALGRMNVENDFASSPLYCNFMNNGLCGDPKAAPGGDVGHSAYPDAVWASRIRLRPTQRTYVQTGLYEVNQSIYNNNGFRSGFKFDDSKDSGVYVPVEIAWEPLFGRAKLPGHYKIGFGYDSSGGYKDYGNTLAAAGVPGYTTRLRTGNTQSWVLVDQMLVRHGDGNDNGIVALAGFVHNDPNNSAYAEQYFAAMIDRGILASRPEDVFGLLFTYFAMSGRLGHAQDEELAYGLTLGNNATGVQTHEMILETNYDIHVLRGLNFEPDFQYVFRPNAQSNIHDAAVFGFKAHVEF